MDNAEKGVSVRMTLWTPMAEQLLCDVLLSFADMSKSHFRHDLLSRMEAKGPAYGIIADISEKSQPRSHIRAILNAAASRGDPLGVLEVLADALTEIAPYDGALPWLRTIVLALTEEAPLPAETMLQLIRALLALDPAPRPQALAPYTAAAGSGLSLLKGGETLAEILLRTAELRHDTGRKALIGFLQAFTADRQSPLRDQLGGVRSILERIGFPVDGSASAAADNEYRLVVQIRLEAEDAEHVEDGRYSLYATCYKQPLSGGSIVRISALPEPAILRKSQLLSSGSEPLSQWSDLIEEMSGSRRPVRIEFILPTSLLGHPAELWSTGAAQQSLGHHHPVVVRSLERYKDTLIGTGPWVERWSYLKQKDGMTEALDLIGWPSMNHAKASEFTEWVIDRPTLACLGLRQPYEQLPGPMRRAVDDVMFTEGVPVVIWRRDGGEPDDVIAALREHNPVYLTELPEIVYQCRRRGRIADSGDVRKNLTLLWEDPQCVDKRQDKRFAGMV